MAVVTTSGDTEAQELFKNADGVKMCANEKEMIEAILDYSENEKYYHAGLNNNQFQKCFDWDKIAKQVLSIFQY